ncbi:MAG: hypothetical protein OEZ65_07555 [Gemmatimonadota bacterium]|nr:hypothetical protein [Gemmatimonadota bacterium]MDH5759431.1 hypothetical protein [Gemmatimonadota bacterium]
MRRQWFALAVILTLAPACDNVEWGGVDVRFTSAAPRDTVPEGGAEAAQDTAAADEEKPAPRGSLLYAGLRDGARIHLSPMGDVQGDAVHPLLPVTQEPEFADVVRYRLLAPGSEFILFARGVRVGRAVVDTVSGTSEFCGGWPAGSGIVELVPGAAGVDRFLALPAEAASRRPHGTYRALSHDYDQRVASLRLAGEMIPQVGARRPPSVLDSRRDIQAFTLAQYERPLIAATFAFLDAVSVGPAPPEAYSLFVLGTPSDTVDYDAGYVLYRPVGEAGKSVPKLLDVLDLNGDGRSEIILEMFGERGRSFASLAERGGEWLQTGEGSCGVAPPRGPR